MTLLAFIYIQPIDMNIERLSMPYSNKHNLHLKNILSSKNTTYSQQKFSGLSWMVKRYYIQDYPEYFRGDTETTRTTASDFIRPSIESSLTRREKKGTSNMWCEWRGKVAFYKLLTWTRLENNNVGIKKIIWRLLIFFHASYMMKFSCYSFSQLWAR